MELASWKHTKKW